VDILRRIRVVVVDMHLHLPGGRGFRELADAGALPGVHQDETFDFLRGDIFRPGDIQEIKTGAHEKIPQVPFLGAGKGQQGVGIELLGRHHGGQGVEVGVEVGGDHLQGSGRGILGVVHERGWAFLWTALSRAAST
jgi:hypothetical protein